MPGAIRHFDLMPPYCFIPNEDAKIISEYSFKGDIEAPEGYKEHYQQMHGNKQGIVKNKQNSNHNIKT